MKHKLIFSLIGLVMVIACAISIYYGNDRADTFKIKLSLIVLGSYLMATFLVSYIFDKIILGARKKGLATVNPYQLLIRINPYINWFVFGFFGVMCSMTILILLFVTNW